MFKSYDFALEYKQNGETKVATGTDTADYSLSIVEGNGTFKYVLHPKKKMELVNAYLSGAYQYTETDRVYVNGYQSWTTSREFRKNDVQHGVNGIGFIAGRILSLFGDYDFQKYSKKPGQFHSYSYTYVNTDGKVKLLGTTTERTGFTVFHHDMAANRLVIQKDVEGVLVEGDYDIFDLFVTEGKYDDVFDEYFKLLNFPKPRLDHMSGYTSWYNYYGNINEKQILRDLDGLATVGKCADIFQIDDGYQSKVGDWYSNDKFPSGMRYVVDNIH